MTRVTPLTKAHPQWEAAAAFAEKSAWRAGPYLARMMRQGVLLDWERVFLAEVDGEAAGYCAFLKKDELPEQWGLFPFIGFVYVEERFRGRRLSEKIIGCALRYAAQCGFGRVYLMSGERGLYEKYGFISMGDYETVFGTVDQLFYKDTGA